MHRRFNGVVRGVLLASRWGMAPLVLGLIAALLLVLAQFFRELAHTAVAFAGMEGSEVILAVLKLVDLALIANLVIMIVGAATELLLPRQLPAAGADATQEALPVVDFSTVKLRVFASISAIAAIYLLERLINTRPLDKTEIGWEILILLSFVVSGVLLALMDRLSAGRH